MIKKTRNSKFRARIFSSGNEIASKVFALKRDADTWEAAQYRALLEGQWVDPKAGAVPVRKVFEDFLAEHEGATNPHTWDTSEANLRLHVPALLKRLPIRAVTSGALDELYTTALKGTKTREALSRSTVQRVRDDLSTVFAWAVRKGMIGVNPVAKSRVPVGGIRTGGTIQPFSRAGLAATLAAQRLLGKRYAEVVEFAALTGLRWGELVALQVGDFATEPLPSILVSRSASDGYAEKGTKSNQVRRVPLIDRAEEILRARIAGKGPEGLIFSSPRGHRMNGGNLKRAIHWTVTAPGHRFHDLRHTAATNWLRAGIDIKTVSQWLGHSTPTITLSIYTHYLGVTSDLSALEKIRRMDEEGNLTQ